MSLPPHRTIVFVLPWNADPPHGGAEATALATARRLIQAGARAEIWTTTCDPGGEGDEPRLWAFEAGESRLGALTIRRFPSFARDARRFHELNERLMLGDVLSREDEAAWLGHGVWSGELRREIHARRDDCLFLFTPYWTPTSVFGAAAAPQESILVPCLHREPHAAFRMVWEMFSSCHRIWFNSESERALAASFYDLSAKRTMTVSGVDYADGELPPAGPLPPQVERPFILAFGRMSVGKGIPRLIEHFRRFMADAPVTLQLVLAGAGPVTAPPGCEGEIVSLGRVEEGVKRALMANALAYILPSERESLSLSLLEAWLHGRPALVNARCDPAREFSLQCRGGIPYRSYAEFRHALEMLAREPDLARAMGERGRAFVKANFQWPHATRRQLAFLREMEQWLAEADMAA